MAEDQKYELINNHMTTGKAGSSITFDQNVKNGSAHVGKAVMFGSVAGEIQLVTNGLEPCGRLEKVEPDGFATYSDQGYMELPVDQANSAITYGGGLLGGATAGTVKTGTNQAVKAVDTLSNSVTVTAFFR